MEVKEAIEFLRLYKYDEPCQESEAIEDIISLLQQGESEKYKNIWEEFGNEIAWGKLRNKDKIIKIMDNIGQKYFPNK